MCIRDRRKTEGNIQLNFLRKNYSNQGSPHFWVSSFLFNLLLIFVFQGRIDEAFGAEFVYEIHAKELVVGEIFVRIYNEQPTFPLDVCHV